MLLLTIGIVSALFIVSYLIFDRDLLAPPTAVALVMLFGCFCCFYNEPKWELVFSPKSTLLITAGIVATIIGGFIGVCLSNYPKVGTYSFSHEKSEPQEIYISTFKTLIVIIFQIVALVLLFLHIRRLTGYSNWMLAVARYRMLTAGVQADINDLSLRMPIITKNIIQFSKMIAIVYSYVVGNNLVASKKKISINWIPIILYTVMTFAQGDRSNMIRLWVVVLVTGYTIHRRSVGWKSSRETRKVIRTMALSVIALGGIFAGFREIVGRTSDKDPLYYVTFYAGSPTAVLNQLWENPISKPDVFGQRILYYFNQSTTALFGWPGRYNFYYGYFRSPNGTSIGNAPTVFRPAFVEFGPIGFALAMILFGAFFTFFYCKSRQKKGDNPIDFRLLIYSYIAYVFLMYFYSTFFDFLSHLMFKYIIELLIIRWALVGWQFKQRVRVTFNLKKRNRNQLL